MEVNIYIYRKVYICDVLSKRYSSYFHRKSWGECATMGNLIPISANVTEEMVTFKNERQGVSWTAIIREGIQAIQIKERLLNQKIPEESYEWRVRAKEKIEEALRMVR